MFKRTMNFKFKGTRYPKMGQVYEINSHSIQKNIMKAILINAENQTLSIVNVTKNNFLEDVYLLLNCKLIEAANDKIGKKPYTLYFDEEGRLSQKHKTGFDYKDGGFVGNGLLIGFNPNNGDAISVEESILTEVSKNVTWLNEQETDDLRNDTHIEYVAVDEKEFFKYFNS